jgi:predicted dehydrogenase
MPRVVVIGTGFGRRSVAPVFQELGWETQIVTPHDAGAIRAAVETPCELVSIHSPPFLHLDHVRIAAGQGRNILCDKPFGLNTAHAEEMLDLANRAGVLHFLNFEFRHDPLRQKLKTILDSGTIGTPSHMSMTAFIGGTRQQSHRWLFEKDHGGWIGAYGSHTVDLLHWLFGDIAAVGGIARTEVKTRPDRTNPSHSYPSTAEDAFTAWFRMKNGVTAMLDTAFSASVNIPAQTILFGSEGACHITGMSELHLLRPGKPAEHHSFPAIDPIQAALTAWLAEVSHAVAKKQQIEPDFGTGLACVRVLDALRGELLTA